MLVSSNGLSSKAALAAAKKKAEREKKEFDKVANANKKKPTTSSTAKKSAPKRRQRKDNDDGDENDSSDDDDNEEDEEDQNQNNNNNNELEIEDFLEDLKTKIHLTLFDHNPSFAIFGMGMNIITNYLSVLFPWADCHVAELEPSVYSSNVLSDDFCQNASDLIESKKKEFEQTSDKNNKKKYSEEVTGKQIPYIGDVVKLLGCCGDDNKQQEQEKDDETTENDNKKQKIPEKGLSVIFLDCFDPVAVNMDHSLQVLSACHRRLRKGGILITNTHMALTNQGNELRPFLDVFGGDEAVQVISMFGYQQALIVCQKAKNFGNKKNSPLVVTPPPQNIKEYRAACRVANACPVFVNVCDGVLRAIDKISFFGNNNKTTISSSTSSLSSPSSPGFVLRSDSIDDENEEEMTMTMKKKSTNNNNQNQQLPSVSEYPSLFCRAKHRIHESCECLACTSKWLDPSVIVESRRLTFTKIINQNNTTTTKKEEVSQTSVVSGRWVTRCIDFKD